MSCINADCLSCAHFTPFRDDYFDDLEPDDEGFCLNESSPYYGNEGAGAGIWCEGYEEISK